MRCTRKRQGGKCIPLLPFEKHWVRRLEQTCDFSCEEAHNDSGEEDHEQADDGVNDRLPPLGHVLLVATCSKNPETTDDYKDDGNKCQECENEVNDFHNCIPGGPCSASRGIRDIRDVSAELRKRSCECERVKEKSGPEAFRLGWKAGEKSHERWLGKEEQRLDLSRMVVWFIPKRN